MCAPFSFAHRTQCYMFVLQYQYQQYEYRFYRQIFRLPQVGLRTIFFVKTFWKLVSFRFFFFLMKRLEKVGKVEGMGIKILAQPEVVSNIVELKSWSGESRQTPRVFFEDVYVKLPLGVFGVLFCPCEPRFCCCYYCWPLL